MMKKMVALQVTCLLVTVMTLTCTAFAGQLRLGMSPEPYMPFTQINQAGEWEGFEADLSHALCDKMGIECTTSLTAWEGLIPALTAGKINFIVGALSITDKRRKVVDFSTSYYNAITVLVGMKSDSTKLTDKKDPEGGGMVVDPAGLKGKIIGFQNGTIQASYAEKYLPGIEAKAYPAADTALADMSAGRIDYVLMDLQPVQTFLKSKNGGDYEVKHKVPANVVLGEGIGYAVKKGDKKTLDKVNAALAALKKEGTLDTLVNKWFFTID